MKERCDDTKLSVPAKNTKLSIPANLWVFVGIRSMSWCDSPGLVPPITLVLICNMQVSFSKSLTLRKRKEDLQLLNTPLTNCFGFVDGTVLCICRPTVNQRVVYKSCRLLHLLLVTRSNKRSLISCSFSSGKRVAIYRW